MKACKREIKEVLNSNTVSIILEHFNNNNNNISIRAYASAGYTSQLVNSFILG
jgi:hypothetical protein